MSDVLFPELPGLDWDLSKTPMFNTNIMTSISGRELRCSYQTTPKYKINMSFSFLREANGKSELQQLEAFFIERKGAFDSFLYQMPADSEYNCTFVGDGVAMTYQLYKTLYSSKIPLGNTQEHTLFEIDPNFWNDDDDLLFWGDDPKLMWSSATAIISNKGLMTLSEPLSAGISLQNIVGTFYYRCRFSDDEQQFTNFMHNLWKANKVELIGSLGSKV